MGVARCLNRVFHNDAQPEFGLSESRTGEVHVLVLLYAHVRWRVEDFDIEL